MIKRLSLNSLWLLLARVGAQGLSLIFVALLARYLDPQGFGQYSLVAALTYLGNAVTTFGTDTLLIRETARSGETSRLVMESLQVQLYLSIAWIAGQGILSLFLPISTTLRIAMFVYSLALMPLTLYTVSSALLRGFEKMGLFSLLSLAVSVVQVVVAALVIILGGGLVALCLGLLIAQVALAILARYLTAEYWRSIQYRPPSADASRLGDLMLVASPLALLTGLAVFSQRLGLFIVSLLMGATATGFFSSASRLTEGLKLGHQSALGAMMPVLSKRDTESTRLFRLSVWAMPLAGGVLALFVTLFARPLIILIYGDGYEAAIGILIILAWALVPYALNATLSLALVTQGADQALAKAALISTAIALIFFVILVRQFGLPGAAWATVASESVQTILLIWTYRTTRPSPAPEPAPYGL